MPVYAYRLIWIKNRLRAIVIAQLKIINACVAVLAVRVVVALFVVAICQQTDVSRDKLSSTLTLLRRQSCRVFVVVRSFASAMAIADALAAQCARTQLQKSFGPNTKKNAGIYCNQNKQQKSECAV